MNESSIAFDEDLLKVDHYKKYPEMMPWIGCGFTTQKIKILLIGESHYLPKDCIYHLDAEAWYRGTSTTITKGRGSFTTRDIISSGTKDNWKKKSRAIYKNTENAIYESRLFSIKPATTYANTAFMNFFQRPAQTNGDSIKPSNLDITVSNEVFSNVVKIIRPDVVIFTSSLAYKAAAKEQSLKYLKEMNIQYTRCPHPYTSWWNRPSKKYENKTGRTHFIDFINKQIDLINA